MLHERADLGPSTSRWHLSPVFARWQIMMVALFALAMLALLLRLGFWQLSRAEYKEGLEQRSRDNRNQEPLALNSEMLWPQDAGWFYRPATGSGRFDAAHEFLLDNRTYNGRAGYHVLTPFDLGGRSILVNRGWVAVGVNRANLPRTQPLPDPLSLLEGTLSTPPRPGLLLGRSGHDAAGDWPRVVQTADLDAMARTLERPLLPAIVLLDAEHPGCHVCDWKPVLGMGPESHRGYAFQWFALALTLVVLCAVVAMRNRNRGN